MRLIVSRRAAVPPTLWPAPWYSTTAIGLVAAIYAWYTFYLGVPVMKKCPPEKAVGYTIVVVLCGIVLAIVLGGVLMSMMFGGEMGAAGAGLVR